MFSDIFSGFLGLILISPKKPEKKPLFFSGIFFRLIFRRPPEKKPEKKPLPFSGGRRCFWVPFFRLCLFRGGGRHRSSLLPSFLTRGRVQRVDVAVDDVIRGRDE
jgi:hypothetical protein